MCIYKHSRNVTYNVTSLWSSASNNVVRNCKELQVHAIHSSANHTLITFEKYHSKDDTLCQNLSLQ